MGGPLSSKISISYKSTFRMNKFPFGGFNHLILKEFCLGFLSYYGYISFRDFNHLFLKEFCLVFLSKLTNV